VAAVGAPAAGRRRFLSVAACFGALIWIHAEEAHRGLLTLPELLAGTITNVQAALIPLVVIAALGLVNFGHSKAAAVATTVWKSRALVAKLVVLGMIGFKLWIRLFRHLGEWADTVAQHPVLTVRVVMSALFFAAVPVWVRASRTTFRRSGCRRTATRSCGGSWRCSAPWSSSALAARPGASWGSASS